MKRRFFVALVFGSVVVFSLVAVSAVRDSGVISLGTSPLASSATETAPQLQSDSPITGVFEGITPCDKAARPLPQIRSDADCEMAIWRIVFGPNSTYELSSSYGMAQPNTTGIRNGGSKVTMQGAWVAPTPTIIRLGTDDPAISVSFLRVSEDILHVLDGNGRMMVGNAGWSYTLNRTDPSPDASSVVLTGVVPEGSIAPITGVFEGRTPCHNSLTGFTANLVPGCGRLKWRLTFYQDPTTGNPTSYVSGVMGRADALEGSWSIVRGTHSNPDSVIYQLTPANEGRKLSFLKLGDNHLFFLNDEMTPLVGDNLLSYTLSRMGN
jgi:hypothetical protein